MRPSIHHPSQGCTYNHARHQHQTCGYCRQCPARHSGCLTAARVLMPRMRQAAPQASPPKFGGTLWRHWRLQGTRQRLFLLRDPLQRHSSASTPQGPRHGRRSRGKGGGSCSRVGQPQAMRPPLTPSSPLRLPLQQLLTRLSRLPVLPQPLPRKPSPPESET